MYDGGEGVTVQETDMARHVGHPVVRVIGHIENVTQACVSNATPSEVLSHLQFSQFNVYTSLQQRYYLAHGIFTQHPLTQWN